MRSLTKLQIIVIASAIVLFVLLLFANTKPSVKEEVAQQNASAEINESDLLQLEIDSLPSELKVKAISFEELLKTTSNDKKSVLLDSIVHFYDDAQKPFLSAHYYQQIAELNGSEENWNKAGNRFYTSVGFAKANERTYLYGRAIKCFEKVLVINDANLSAKTRLGACYVEGTADPMKGITLLREVVSKDSTFVEAHVTLGFFAIKSGQLDKAAERFNKVLAIKPDYVEAYLFLADTYEKLQEKDKAIDALEKYINKVDDVTIKTEVRNYINKLKNS